MKSIFDKLLTVLILPMLLLRRNYFWHLTDRSKLPGIRFAEYGFNLGKKLLIKRKLSLRLLLNPVSIFRYFEFDFADINSKLIDGMRVLDVSSPYLFGFYQSEIKILEYYYINPDRRDLNNVASISRRIRFNTRYSTDCINALNLNYPPEFFDRIFSISVIEHISGDGDSEIMKELWRVLKPNGLLVLTFPTKKNFEIEYKKVDEYKLNPQRSADKYFFQRIYNKEKIEERLLSSLSNYEIVQQKVFGVNHVGFYENYRKRWTKNSYWETVKDPYYISTKFSYYNDIDDLEDIGVIGLTIKKLE